MLHTSFRNRVRPDQHNHQPLLRCISIFLTRNSQFSYSFNQYVGSDQWHGNELWKLQRRRFGLPVIRFTIIRTHSDDKHEKELTGCGLASITTNFSPPCIVQDIDDQCSEFKRIKSCQLLSTLRKIDHHNIKKIYVGTKIK